MNASPRFQNTSCSQCGHDLGPGDSGVSHCSDHEGGNSMSAVHTPGPWFIYGEGHIDSEAVRSIAIVTGAFTKEGWSGSDYATKQRRQANARLIAAAPTTAEKAMAFTFIVERFMRGDLLQGIKPATEAEVADALYELRNHIAAATGQA